MGWREGTRRWWLVLRAKACDSEMGPLPIAIPGGQTGAAEADGGGLCEPHGGSELRPRCHQTAPECGVWQGGLRPLPNIMSSFPVYSFCNFQSPYPIGPEGINY